MTLILENDLLIERNNQDICSHLLAAQLHVKYIFFNYYLFYLLHVIAAHLYTAIYNKYTAMDHAYHL